MTGARMKRRLVASIVAVSLAWMLMPWLKVLCWGLPLCFRGEPAQLPMPVPRLRAMDVADTFGAPRGGGRRHEGVDIFAPRHTPILSTTAGVVVSVGDNRLGGHAVWIMGPGGQWHYYAHLESLGEIRVGQRVPAVSLWHCW